MFSSFLVKKLGNVFERIICFNLNWSPLHNLWWMSLQTLWMKPPTIRAVISVQRLLFNVVWYCSFVLGFPQRRSLKSASPAFPFTVSRCWVGGKIKMWVVVVMGGRARSLSRLCDFSMALLFLKEKVLFSGGSEVSAHEVCVAGEEVLRRLRKQTLTHSQRKGEYKQEMACLPDW